MDLLEQKYDKCEKIWFLRICVSDKKIGILKKLRWDISDTGNRIIVILEDLTTIQKITKKYNTWTLIRQSRWDICLGT
jgi:hypothetical protein